MRARIPIVSVIGRPNVGKSSLFNRMAGRKVAVVDDVPGVTRDRNYADTSWDGRDFTLVDTGGLVPTSRNELVKAIHEQVDIAIEESAAIVLVVEAGTGPTDLDLLIAARLRKQCPQKVVLAANKAESKEGHYDAGRHMSLGCGEPMPVSALHGRGVADLMDRILVILGSARVGENARLTDADIAIAVVGRPNAGKSLLVNRLVGTRRMIVDSSPGTTRDSIDTLLSYRAKTVRLIDTAGLRRKSQVKEKLEYYTNVRALQSIERADVCALLIDATEGVASQDLKILAKIDEARKGVVVCFNKWDLVPKDHRTFDVLCAEVRRQYKELRHVPAVSISALTGQRVRHVLDTALAIQQRLHRRIAATELTDELLSWTRSRPHPLVGTKEVRFLGARQSKSSHVLFVLYCTNPRLVQPSYQRYLVNRIHQTFDFLGCPVALSFRRPGRRSRRHVRERVAQAHAAQGAL